MNKKEKWFNIISIAFIIGCFLFYGGRLIYYYKVEHPTIAKTDTTLISAIIKNNNLAVVNDGLYKTDDDNYYFKGKNLNNYVYYSGRIFQIVSINKDSIKLITKDNQTSLAWGITNKFSESYVNTWLNDLEKGYFLKSLDSYEEYLVNSSFCVDNISLDNLICNNEINNYVGLITVKEYLTAGGIDSYLNNSTYFWTSNTSDEKIWYIFPEGGLNDNSKTSTTYYSYGVRPVINIKKDLNINGGTGTLDDPFILGETNKLQVGSYLNYNNYNFKVMELSDSYIKLILSNNFKVDEDYYEEIYDNKNSLYSVNNPLSKYLNNEFYNTLNKEQLIKCNFNIGNYTNYNYQSVSSNKISTFVGLPSIGEFFINDDNETWLTNNINNIKLSAYKALSDGRIYADDIKEKNYVRPVICLSNYSIKDGNGLSNNPFTMEVNNETND